MTYGPEWEQLRQETLDRDGHRCRKCGRRPRKLDVHHIVPWSVAQSHVELLTLCSRCHLLLEQRISVLVRQLTAAFLEGGLQMAFVFPTPLPGFWQDLELTEIAEADTWN